MTLYYFRIIAPERNKKGKTKCTSVSLSLSDIQSLSPGRDISDAVVDLYIRYAFLYSHKTYILYYSFLFDCREMLLHEDVTSTCVVSSLTYTGIARVAARKDDKNLKKDMAQLHQSVNGTMDIKRPLIVFPCRLT